MNERCLSNKISQFTRVLVFLALVFVSSAFSTFAAPPESSAPIRIVINNWTSQIVLSNILGRVYGVMGYTVEYPELDTHIQWGRIHRGFEHIQVEVWEGTMSKEFKRVAKYGQMIDAGSHDVLTREEWWYPTYVEEVCPGLPDWRALKKCAALFATEKTAPKGRYVMGPWEKPEEARIRALGLNFVPQAVTQADDLWVELDKAYRQRKPIVLFNWSPNWVEARYEGRFIEFPRYDPKCESDPSWGINQDWTFDCGNPTNGWLKKAAWIGMQQQWPCAFDTLLNMNFDNAMIAAVAALVDADGLSHEQAADRWMQDNEVIWKKWVPKQCRPPRNSP